MSDTQYNSERIVSIALNNVPALPAKKFNGTFMQEVDKQFYLVFDWVDGKSLKPNEINIVHCEKIGFWHTTIKLEKGLSKWFFRKIRLAGI